MIRQARPEDAQALQAIAEAAYTPYVAEIGRRPAPMDADFNAHIARREAWATSGASGAPVGYVILIPGPETLWIDNIAVAPASQGAGVGRALMRFAEQEAHTRGYRTLDLYTNAKMRKNIALYQRLGFQETGRRVQDGFDRVFFQKDIGAA